MGWKSYNGEYAIGILEYLFDLKCIQVLHKSNKQFYVIEEYKGYDIKKINKLLVKLKKVFDDLDEN